MNNLLLWSTPALDITTRLKNINVLFFLLTLYVSFFHDVNIFSGNLCMYLENTMHTSKVKLFFLLQTFLLLHFVVLFHVASLFSTGVDNEKALELTISTVFHRGRQWKSSRAGQQNISFIFQPDLNIEISPKNATKHPVA